VAERTVSVRLKANVDAYKAAMTSAGKATQDVARSADKWKNLGQSAASLGDSLTTRLTLPIVAVGAAAVKMSLDFDKSFQQMHQLAGVSAGEIDGMKESVLGLAGETGKAPTELAEALYFLRSSGLEGAAAMDALEMSAKASAAGMGSTVEIADAVSSAMNAYAESGLTAAEATDVLVATAREGKAEPAELAGQMGKLLPLASELGISFNDVGAALATFSLSGNDAAGSSTLLQNLMSKLLRPSQQAQEQLSAVGISLDDIRSIIADRGLLGAVLTLQESLGQGGFTRFWEDAQATQAALALVGGDLDATKDRFEALGDSAGDTDEAFGKWAETMGAKNAQAFAELQVAMIRIGDAIAPIAADAVSFAAKIVDAFAKLPRPVQNAVLAFAAIAAAIGPLLSVGGRVVSAVSNIAKAFSSTLDFAGRFGSGFRNANAAASSFSGTAGTLGGKMRGLQAAAGVAAGAAGIAGLVLAMRQMSEAAKQATVEDMVEGILAAGDALDQFSDAEFRTAERYGVLDRVFNQLKDSNAAAAERFLDAAEAAGVSTGKIDEMRAALERKRDADSQSAADSDANTAAVEEAAGAFDEETAAITETVAALQAYAEEIAAMSDPLLGLNSALQQNRDAQGEVIAKELELAAAREAGDPLAVMAAEQALTDARFAAGESAFGVAQAEATLAAALAEQPELIANVNSMLDGFVSQGLITEDQARLLADRFGVLGDRVEAVPERAGVEVSETGAAATTRSIRGVEGAVEDVPRSRNTHVTETNTGRARVNIQSVRDAAASVPTRRNTHTATSGTGPARRTLDDVRNAANRIPSGRHVRVTTTTGGTVSALDAVTSAVNRIPRSTTISVGFNVYGTAELNRARALAGRARGGPVMANQAYVVGEEGPELLLMAGQSGTVYPNSVFGQAGGTAALASAPTTAAVSPDALVRGINAGTREAVAKQIAADSVHFHWLAGSIDTSFRRGLDHIENGIETLIRQNQLGAKNVRWFEDLASIPVNRQFADGGIVAKVHAGEMVLNGAQQARLWNMIESGSLTPGAVTAGDSIANYNIDLRGALVPNGPEVEKAVFRAIAKGGERGRPLTVRGRRL
jgi:TP901 family phage tail tape measure protein